MHSLYKLLKALNSAQKPWQISLAVSLGMLMGLTPASGLQTWLILLIAFLVNIPLGVFFLFAAQFAIIGYFLDPIFDSFGFAVLHMESLQGFWTALYNSGWARLTHFQNSVVLGSNLIGLILFLPVLLLFNRLVRLYRSKILTFLSKWHFLNRFGLFTMEAEPTKKIKTVRIWGAGIFAGVVVLSGVIIFVFMDAWMKSAIEVTGKLLTGKETVIEKLTTDLSEGRLTINNMAMASKRVGRSSVQTEDIVSDIDFNALLLGKVHVEQVLMKGMRFDQENALFDVKESARPQNTTSDTASQTGSNATQKRKDKGSALNLPDIKSLLAKSDLKIVKRYKEADKMYQQIKAKWDKVVNQEFGQASQNALKQEFNQLKAESKHLNVKNIKAFKAKVDAFGGKIKAKRARIHQLEVEYAADQKQLKDALETIKKAKQEDFQALKAKYHFDKGGALNVIGDVAGQKVQGYVETADSYYQQAAPYLSDEDAVSYDRHKGREVRFKSFRPEPDFWIKSVDIEGIVKDQNFKAEISDITNDQKALKKSTRFKIISDGKGTQKLLIEGSFNRLEAKSVDSVHFQAARIKDMPLDLALIKVSKADVKLNGDLRLIDGAKLQGKAHLNYIDVKMASQHLKGKMKKALDRDLAKEHRFSVDLEFKGTLKAPEIVIKSSLEQIVKRSINRLIQAEVKAFETKLHSALDQLADEKLKALGVSSQSIKRIKAYANGDKAAMTRMEQDLKKSLKIKKPDLKKIKVDKKALDRLKKFKF